MASRWIVVTSPLDWEPWKIETHNTVAYFTSGTLAKNNRLARWDLSAKTLTTW